MTAGLALGVFAAAQAQPPVIPFPPVMQPQDQSYQQFLALLQREDAPAADAGNATPDGSTPSISEGRLPRPSADAADAEQLPLPSGTPAPAGDATSGAAAENPAGENGAEDDPDQAKLTLADVIASLYRSYPEILQAREEIERTRGGQIATFGAFDTVLNGFTLNEPTGFYENYRHGLGAARRTWWGGYLSAGYRIGRGDFQPWFKERETNEGGEFKVGIGQALLQGRAIDPYRVAVFQASLDRQAAGPIIQQAILYSAQEAALFYWEWVAAGALVQAQRELLDLAEERGEQIEVGFRADKFAEIDLVFNRQLIAERRAMLLKAEQKYRTTTFKLSLYLRGESGQPVVPAEAWLPHQFPEIEPPADRDFAADLAAALSRRPEPQLLQLEIRRIEWERQLAYNDRLPRLDLVAEASQDVGGAASNPDNKGPFELLVGLEADVPIQRRKARGKVIETTAKIAQTTQKLRLQRDKIGAELRTAYNRLQLAEQIVTQAELSLRAAFDALDRFKFGFQQGKVDLIALNLIETTANETEIKLVEAQQEWFSALAALQLALGLDPLDQAMVISALPDSDRPGPGNLPEFGPLDQEAFDADWRRRNQGRP